jgi:hypothetical protein
MDGSNDTVGEGKKFVQVFGFETRNNEISWKIRCRRPTLGSVEHTGKNRLCLFTLIMPVQKQRSKDVILYIHGQHDTP